MLGKHNTPMRTYRDLLQHGYTHSGSICCSCHRYEMDIPHRSEVLEMWHDKYLPRILSLGTRAGICWQCCEKKGDAVLGPIVRSERKARRYVRDHMRRGEAIDVRFYAHLTGASEEFIAAEVQRQTAT